MSHQMMYSPGASDETSRVSEEPGAMFPVPTSLSLTLRLCSAAPALATCREPPAATVGSAAVIANSESSTVTGASVSAGAAAAAVAGPDAPVPLRVARETPRA
jgi:hypothetical protein